MRILVWQWGKFGAGPRVAADFAALFNTLPGTDAALSLSARAEILAGPHRPRCELPMPTYASVAGYAARALSAPFMIPRLARQIAALQPDVALCAMPGPLDLVMHAALRRVGVPYAVVVHDAEPHPGDGRPLQMTLQKMLLKRADALVVLSAHVRARLDRQGFTDKKIVLRTTLPPHTLLMPPPPPRAHGQKLRLLCFGRLLPYKGLDLLAEALSLLLPRPDIEVRVVGQGPESEALSMLRGLPGVSVENRWIPEDEVGSLLAWSDAVVLTHREASQSGVAAAALAARRWIVSTRVGGIAEQLYGQPGAILCEIDALSIARGLLSLLEHPPDAAAMAPPDWQRDAAQLAEQLWATLGKGKEERVFFFEKKKQKTFIS
jgi:glycosyltransferase involved in cell wall biosynthesis